MAASHAGENLILTTPLLDWKLDGERFHSLRVHTEA